MKRKAYAQFLTTYIAERVDVTSRPLTVALDAGWGTGKTFFVNNWAADLKRSNGGVILFDAWKNDFATDPLTSFMAELSNGMKGLEKRISKTNKLKRTITETSSSMLKGFSKAAGPATAVIAKGVLAKLTGVAVDQLTEAMQFGGATEEPDWGKITEETSKSMEKGLEAFFEKTLEDHRRRANAAEGFRNSLELLVKSLKEAKAISGPLYIFVDELDRCRPDYAIKLLEGIKHLFAVPGVVFVVSTHLDQLSKSVQAIYGTNFDGYNYLKRFFEFEFTLPDPDVYEFSNLLMQELPLFEGRKTEMGLHRRAYADEEFLLGRSFEAIAKACKLPLRDQRRVWNIASAAASGVPSDKAVSTLWLFFLASLKHAHPRSFDALRGPRMDEAGFKAVCNGIGSMSVVLVKSISPADSRGVQTFTEIALVHVLWVYYRASFRTLDQIEKIMAGPERSDYPNDLETRFIGERPQSFFQNVQYRPSISRYFDLVQMAGLIS